MISGAKKEGDIYKAVEKLSNNFWLSPFIYHNKEKVVEL